MKKDVFWGKRKWNNVKTRKKLIFYALGFISTFVVVAMILISKGIDFSVADVLTKCVFTFFGALTTGSLALALTDSIRGKGDKKIKVGKAKKIKYDKTHEPDGKDV